MRKGLIICGMMVGLFFSQFGYAMHHHSGMMNCHKKMQQQLQLTKEQQAKIKQIKEMYYQQAKQTRSQMKALRKQAMTLVQSDKMDEAKLDAVANKYGALFSEKFKAKLKMKNAMYQLLTAKQKEKFNKHMKQKKCSYCLKCQHK